MNFTKEQIDFVKHCGEHFEVLTSGRGHSKTKQIIEQLQQENARLKEERKKIKEYVEKCNFDNAEILYDFGSEYCYIDDFKEHILEILKEN